jgi:alcohol dehydrogenase (NADP+)
LSRSSVLSPATIQTIGCGATSTKSPLAPFSFHGRESGPRDVAIEILYCGLCHSDLHAVGDDWGGTVFPAPLVTRLSGAIGRVSQVGEPVKGCKAGDLAGVGCMVPSCRTCSSCREGLEQYCESGFTGTYNGEDKILWWRNLWRLRRQNRGRRAFCSAYS